jgi:hypothetical protein
VSPIVRVGRSGPLPLSYGQEQLWFLSQLHPTSTAYNVTLEIALRGPLHRTALLGALDDLVARHEILRMRCAVQAGVPVQTFDHPPAWPIDVGELGASDDRALAIAAARRHEAGTRFDLAGTPLVRGRLLCLDDTHHVLLLTMHHIVTDGWSVRILLQDMLASYEARAAGRSAPPPEARLDYGDYAAWQRTSQQRSALDEQLQYWREQLADLPRCELPRRHGATGADTTRGSRISVDLPGALIDRLKALSRERGVTLFMTLLAGFELTLARLTDRTDVIVGSVAANRSRPELQRLAGFFANTIVLRTSFDGSPSFADAIDRVRRTVLGAYAHQDAPFELVVRTLGTARKRRRAQLFQVLFFMRPTMKPIAPVAGLSIEAIDYRSPEHGQFEIAVALTDTAQGLAIELEYADDLFDPDLMADAARRYERLLHDMCDRPSGQLALATSPRAHDEREFDEDDPPSSSASLETPPTELHLQICAIWREVLGVAHVGVSDDFFELGGHSLVAAQAAARLSALTGVELTVRTIFDAPTVAALADRILSATTGSPVGAASRPAHERSAAADTLDN